MGSWFANIGVRKRPGVGPEEILRRVSERCADLGYGPAASPGEADVSFAVTTRPGSQWFSLYSDGMGPGEPFQSGLAAALSAALGTETLEIACFDSDYLYLNLIDAGAKLDAWAGVGSAAGMGIKRRTGLAAWKERVEDFPRFQEAIRQRRVCAEDVLADVAPCLGLPAEQSNACYEELGDGEGERLHFKAPAGSESGEPPRFIITPYNLTPCQMDVGSGVSALNRGRGSRGVSVYFVGPYVEHDEITFSDVGFCQWKKNRSEFKPFELEKIRLPDGRYAYYHNDPSLWIPGHVEENGVFTARTAQGHFERSIYVRFVPHGNPRKALDITVVVAPNENPEGYALWNVWQPYGSKAAFIADYNQTCGEWNARVLDMPLMREEDFD